MELEKSRKLEVLYFEKNETIFEGYAFNPKGNRNFTVKVGNVCNKNSHGASVIVNSENAGMI